jgi:predicted transcriptional regulator of viral defense system
MQSASTQKALSLFEKHDGLLRTTQAIRLGIQPRTLYALRDSGLLIQESRGIYRLAKAAGWSNPDLALVALRVPKGVVCLISALAFHGLTTQIPHMVYLALPPAAEEPRLEYPPLRLFWFAKESHSAGVEQHDLDGVLVRIYGPAKTVSDCFKFRNKIGIDVALEALKECLKQKNCTVQELLDYARLNRVERVMRPYLEALI